MNGVFVTANNTDAGKTWIGSRLLSELLNQNISVQVRKPVESGWPSNSDLSSTDAFKLAQSINKLDELDIICPNRFTAAIAPDRSAMLEGKTLSVTQLYEDCTHKLVETDFLYVEGAGGFYSPICEGGLNADLAEALQLPILLIVANRLGCINQALLNIEAIANRGLKLSAIVLNSTEASKADIGMDNLSDIQKWVDCEVISIKYNQESPEPFKRLAQLLI